MVVPPDDCPSRIVSAFPSTVCSVPVYCKQIKTLNEIQYFKVVKICFKVSVTGFYIHLGQFIDAIFADKHRHKQLEMKSLEQNFCSK